MSDYPPNGGPLGDHHNVARYYGYQAISDKAPLPNSSAFELTAADKEHLSANWLEYFREHDFDIALIGIRCALIRKGRTIGAQSQFAVLNVGAIKDAISQLEYEPRIIRKVVEFDESHVGIYVRREKAMVTAEALAKLVRFDDIHSGRGQKL